MKPTTPPRKLKTLWYHLRLSMPTSARATTSSPTAWPWPIPSVTILTTRLDSLVLALRTKNEESNVSKPVNRVSIKGNRSRGLWILFKGGDNRDKRRMGRSRHRERRVVKKKSTDG